MKPKITARARGPLLVEGEVDLIDTRGDLVDLSNKKHILLCRCGATRTPPLCDGSHYRIGFEPPADESPSADSADG